MAMVESPTTPFRLLFIDLDGKPATVTYHLLGITVDPTDPEPASLASTTAALSDLILVNSEVMPFAQTGTPVTPDTAPYDRVQDKLKLEFQAADGSTVTYELPAFISADLGADKINVDPAAGAIAPLLTYLFDNCCSADGQALIRYKRGFKMRPSGQKKH